MSPDPLPAAPGTPAPRPAAGPVPAPPAADRPAGPAGSPGLLHRLLRLLVRANVRLSELVNRALGPRFSTDGITDFAGSLCRAYLRRRMRLYDVGAGKRPLLGAYEKAQLGVSVVGVDVSPAELAGAEPGAYDATMVADVMELRGAGDGDLVICQALLEHVPDVERALAGIRSLLRPGGHALIFVPCRNAAFARLNLLLPEGIKRRILFALFPQSRRIQGFPSYYDRCTPAGLERILRSLGFETVEERRYHVSTYLFVFFPLYLVWQVWMILVVALGLRSFCETMSFAVRLRERQDR